MQSTEKDNLILVRLFPEEKVIDCLKQVCSQEQVETAVVVSGLGQIKEAKLGFFKEKGDYLPQVIQKNSELLSLTGNISQQPEGYNFHLHAVLGKADKSTVGGHFISGVVSVTAEIALLKTDIKIVRKIEEKTGLSGMFLSRTKN